MLGGAKIPSYIYGVRLPEWQEFEFKIKVMQKWSEVFIISWLEDYYSNYSNVIIKRKIECVLSELDPYVWISPFDGARYYFSGHVKKSLGLMYNDLENAYANQGYGELS
jgi:hypothetical protein